MKKIAIYLLLALNITTYGQNQKPKNDFKNNSGTFIDKRDNKKYKWVQIGKQIWMAENLAYTGNNGHQKHITNGNFNDNWENNYNGWCYYDNDSLNKNKYGVLYQWKAAKKACPAGWHLPSHEEWSELENYLIKNGYNWDGTTQDNKIGKSLAAKSGWKKSTTNIWNKSKAKGHISNDTINNNRIGFNALPGGLRTAEYGWFESIGDAGYWWSSTRFKVESVMNDVVGRGCIDPCFSLPGDILLSCIGMGSLDPVPLHYRNRGPWIRSLYYFDDNMSRRKFNKRYGFSVRCLKDN